MVPTAGPGARADEQHNTQGARNRMLDLMRRWVDLPWLVSPRTENGLETELKVESQSGFSFSPSMKS